MAWYAWTNFKLGAEVEKETGVITKVNRINTGDEVSKEKLKCSNEEWDSFVERGLVREEKYPNIGASTSPFRARMAEENKGDELRPSAKKASSGSANPSKS